MIIKVCGMREADNIRAVENLHPDWMGFIFWNGTKRNVTAMPAYMPVNAKRVGVFVDTMPQTIIDHIHSYKLDMIQLHGNETPTLCRNLRNTMTEMAPHLKIIKAFSISTAEDIKKTEDYYDCADYFVFDTRCDCVGGSGEQFDWDILKEYNGDIPFILSGGIGPDDVDRVKAFHHQQFAGIDLNSKFETAPAVKDIDKLRNFINKIR